MMIKGQDIEHIAFGDSFTDDRFPRHPAKHGKTGSTSCAEIEVDLKKIEKEIADMLAEVTE